MNKDDFNSLFREYARKSLSPTQKERDFVTAVYKHICAALKDNCIQIGSYPRFTSITPLHDLDVLYVIGDMNKFLDNPMSILSELQQLLETYFKESTKYKVKFSLQTHSVTISFFDENNQEFFGVDVVPAYISGKNEFELDMYIVPEIIKMNRRKRTGYYQEKIQANESVEWVKSDPKGYIEIASNYNENNSDYRKIVKVIKKWKHSVSNKNDQFKLKSFHVEQIVVNIFKENPRIEIFDAIFKFFCELPNYITKPQIKDRADEKIFIDQYLNDLSIDEKSIIVQARDYFLINLEDFMESNSLSQLFSGHTYKRFSVDEKYLFDDFIPVLIEKEITFKIDGRVTHKPGFREGLLSLISWKIETYRYIEFSIRNNDSYADIYKWKVKNDNSSLQPRGEITDHMTKNNPESTKYIGDHYVECYAIKNSICIAKHRINVSIG